MWDEIAEQIKQATNQDFVMESQVPVGGGQTNESYKLECKPTNYFVKLNSNSRLSMFESEAIALEEIAKIDKIRVPEPICCGIVGNKSFLALSWIEFGPWSQSSWMELGRSIANLHRFSTQKKFGWDQDNFIGSSPQQNPWHDNWAEFFTEQRIKFQLELAKAKGFEFDNEKKLLKAIYRRLAPHRPESSLLHGDLWCGYVLCAIKRMPVIFDPSSYFGDREVDLAMTELFGGFPEAFYLAYNETWPVNNGYSHRINIYNLYHILNHLNMFGDSYYSQAKKIVHQIIEEYQKSML